MVDEIFPGYNRWEPNKAPVLECTFTDEFGDKHSVRSTLTNSTLHEVYAAMRLSCLGFGFHENSVKEKFGESV